MKKIFVFLLTLFVFLPAISRADGGMFPPDNQYIYETGQNAAIFFADGNETLVLSTSFEGDAKDFSWIIPTPSKPDVTKISKDIFTNLEELTQVEATKYDMGYANLSTGAAALDMVEVLEQKQIGYYDITVLKSDDKNALYVWLNENGYRYPEEGKYILDDYVRLGWTFTAVKIADDALADTTVTQDLNTGDMSPLRLVFANDKIVFPLKISGVARFFDQPTFDDYENAGMMYSYPYYPDAMPVTLYIFADHKQSITGFVTDYANLIDAKTIDDLATDENGNSWVSADGKYYLTKLYNYMNLSDMDEDLYPQDASDNTLVGVLSLWEKAANWFIENIVYMAILLLLMFFLPAYWQFKKASKLCHIFSWISQIVSFVFLGIIPFVYAIIIIFGMSYYSYMYANPAIFIGLPYLVMPLMMLSLLVYELIWQRKNIVR